MKPIAVGESDFKKLRDKGSLFVDKSMFIKEILDDSNSVVLITRPRRFGKTLNMSMLRYFLDCNLGDNRHLFEGLKIMEQGEKYTSKIGTYSCIYMTLKSVQGADKPEMIDKMKSTIQELYDNYRFLLDSEKVYPEEKEDIRRILQKDSDFDLLTGSIKKLSKILSRVYNKPVMFLLDEYDVPLQTAYVNKFYDKVKTFWKLFFIESFKDNSYLEKTVITGVTRVAKESIFTGANNFTVCTVLDDDFSKHFGITRRGNQ